MKYLLPDFRDLRDDFDAAYPDGVGCSCHINPPCNYCTHPGNPDNLNENRDAWIELPDMALSIRQPWAWAIVNLGKNIENRSWYTNFRGPFLLHAAKNFTSREYVDGIMYSERVCDAKYHGVSTPRPDDLERGGIVGMAKLVDCVQRSDNPWFMGRWGFVLEDIQPLPFIPCRGQLGFFKPTL